MGQFRSLLRWYRLKSNDVHLFLKISGKGYLDDQPVSVSDAVAFAEETLEACAEMGTILEQDKRTLVVIIDLREADTGALNILPFIKYSAAIGARGWDIDRIEVLGADEMWAYACRYAPKSARDRMVLK